MIYSGSFRLRKRSSHQTLFRSIYSQPLHNLSPSYNPLNLRRRILKGKDLSCHAHMWRQEVFVRISTLPFNGGEGLSTNIYPINSQKLSKFRIPSFDFIHSTSRYLLNGQFSVRLDSLLFTYFISVQAILLTL